MSTEPENPGMPRNEKEECPTSGEMLDKPFLVKIERIETATIELYAKDFQSAARGALNTDVSEEDFKIKKVYVSSIEALGG